jgi:hypothetical protein
LSVLGSENFTKVFEGFTKNVDESGVDVRGSVSRNGVEDAFVEFNRSYIKN